MRGHLSGGPCPQRTVLWDEEGPGRGLTIGRAWGPGPREKQTMSAGVQATQRPAGCRQLGLPLWVLAGGGGPGGQSLGGHVLQKGAPISLPGTEHFSEPHTVRKADITGSLPMDPCSSPLCSQGD